MTIHLVYPHQNRISAPNVIGFQLAAELRKHFNVIVYDWDSVGTIKPSAGDILIGHPHPISFTIFRNSIKLDGWTKKIIMQPYNSDYNQIGYLDDVIDECDLFLAITGDYWFNNVKDGPTLRWHSKMVQLNLAVAKSQFPKIKTGFNSPGERKFIYIGNDHPGKNLSYLSAIATKLCTFEFAWAGKGAARPNLKKLGYVDFSSQSGRQIVADYDFMITVGSADANPTTILEALAWGLIPICTPTSGYWNELGIVNIPFDDVELACTIISELQFASSEHLMKLTEAGDILLSDKYNWPTFFKTVLCAIFSKASPKLGPRHGNSESKTMGIFSKEFIKLVINNARRYFKTS